ncbi:MAG TPA: ATP-binding protein [Myxococcales bacterium]|nr:ATP-binding protein [Myxococcales bacterium]
MLQRTPHRLQERWFIWLVERNRKGTVRVLWITLALYPTFGVLDYLLAPHTALPLLYGTRAFVTLLTLVLLRVVRRPLFERHSNLISSSFIFLAAGGISLMTVFMGGLESPYYAGLSLVIVGTGLLFVWPPKVVLSTHALIVASFVIPNLVYVREAPGMVQSVSNLFFLMSTAIIVGTGQFFTFRWQREQQVAQIVLADTKANLEKAHEQLKQLDRFKSQFFANITHEFKTPLAMILSPLELLLHGEGGEIGPTQRVTFEMMFRSGMKLLKMIGDLLDLSKLEESRLRLKIGEHDLAEQLRALCDQVQPLAQRKRIELKLVAPANCLVHCDLERMERAFINLLSNALKFTHDDGHVTVSLHDLGHKVWIVVKDDGPGFPPAMAERLFERFFQVDMAETRRHGGTGIGLALAREIVELHGGRIRAENDHGARFTVELVKGQEHFRPEVLDRRSQRRDVLTGTRAGDRGLMDFAAQMQAREEFRLLDIHEATERRALTRDPEEDTRPHTCLVVEDTPDVIRMVGMALQQDFKMLSAPDGLQGLEIARKELPSLIVTDLMMPGMDGLELTRRLRDDPTTRHIPIVMLTARGELEDRVAGIDTGVNSYLAKPFSPRELLSAARGLVKTQAAQADILLTQRMDSLESIAGGLAHEINNPLNYVKNALARVRMDTLALMEISRRPQDAESAEQMGRLEKRMRELFDVAESGIRRITRTVELMGSYSRAGYARQLRPHDAFEAARDVVGIVLPATGRKVQVDLRLEGDGRVECVPEEFNQALTNLVQNAIEAAPDDGSGRVEVHGRVEDGRLVVSVKDNGPGIKPEDRARLFTPFFTTKGPGRGMGMGLTIAWRVVQSLGGTLDIDGSPGHGACFTLRVPRAQPARGVA